MREILPFAHALLKFWWALMSCAVFTMLSIFAAATHRGDAWMFWASVVLALLLFLIAAFLAWRKEYLANIVDPFLLIDWRSLAARQRCDEIDFWVQSKEQPALQIHVHEFSRPDLEWSFGIDIPLIRPGERKVVPASFLRWTTPERNASEIGYLAYILNGRAAGEELTVKISYSNLKGTRFTRAFVLSWAQVGPDRVINCRPGKLELSRTS